MTEPKIDTQAPERAEVEELARQLDRGDQMDGKTVNCKHDACNCALMSDAAEMLRALLAERDLSAAREAAAAQAMREAAAEEAKSCCHEGDYVARAIRTLPIPADAQAALDRLIAERVREAVDRVSKLFEWCASTLVPADYAQGYREALEHVRDAARGSKEGSPTIPDEQRIRQDERTAIAAYIGMSPSEVTDRQHHMEAIRTGLYRDDPLMQRGGMMEGGDG